ASVPASREVVARASHLDCPIRIFPPFEPTGVLAYPPCVRLGWTRPVRTGDRHDAVTPTHARRHAGPESVSTHATVVRVASLPIRAAFRTIRDLARILGQNEGRSHRPSRSTYVSMSSQERVSTDHF